MVNLNFSGRLISLFITSPILLGYISNTSQILRTRLCVVFPIQSPYSPDTVPILSQYSHDTLPIHSPYTGTISDRNRFRHNPAKSGKTGRFIFMHLCRRVTSNLKLSAGYYNVAAILLTVSFSAVKEEVLVTLLTFIRIILSFFLTMISWKLSLSV